MKIAIPIMFLISVVMVGSSCASWKQNRWLSTHKKELDRLANSNLSPEQKLDGLVQDYIKFMNEDLKFIDPRKGVKYVKKYHDQNQKSMQKILDSSANWQESLNTVDKVALGVRTIKKPYVKDLIDLAPKFKRKYKQYAIALKLLGKIGGGLTHFVGKELF